ncbi:MAG: hypothetical protein ACU85V_20305, partial [Gammaproteobacteria bacterium]
AKQLVVLLVSTSLTAGVNATTVIYTDKAAWETAVDRPFLTEEFADAVLDSGVSFVSNESGMINPAQEYYQDVMASTNQNDPMTTWSFTPDVIAYGGEWTLGGPGGSGNSLLVYVDDTTLVGAIPSSFNGGFWGFVSDTPITSVKLVGGSGSNQQTYNLDDMVYAPVPLPLSAPLLVSGLGALVAAAGLDGRKKGRRY